MAEFDGEHAGDQDRGRPSASDQPLVPARVARSMPAPFGVPRRFGIGTLLVVTAAYGALLALLRAMDWHRGVIAVFVGFISLIGLGQMLLFRAGRPRKASIVTGAVCFPIVQLFFFLPLAVRSWDHAGTELLLLLYSTLFGAAAGYLAGCVVAGVFLIMDAVERTIGDKRPPAVR